MATNYAGAINARTYPPKLTFAANVPQTIALKDVTGKVAPSQFGDSDGEIRFTLTDDRSWFAPRLAAAKIKALGIQPGELFTVTKQSVPGAKYFDWCVERPSDAAEPEPERDILTNQLVGSLAVVRNNAQKPAALHSNATPPASVQPSTNTGTSQSLMGRCLIQAIDAVREAEAYAKRIGYPLELIGEDVRALGISLYIQQGRG
ncbi:MAG: hypothetical protein NVSMB64_26130 [Candidatus Velthaea sp.]